MRAISEESEEARQEFYEDIDGQISEMNEMRKRKELNCMNEEEMVEYAKKKVRDMMEQVFKEKLEKLKLEGLTTKGNL